MYQIKMTFVSGVPRSYSDYEDWKSNAAYISEKMREAQKSRRVFSIRYFHSLGKVKIVPFFFFYGVKKKTSAS